MAGFLVDSFIDKKHVGDIALKKQKSSETVKKFEPLMQEVVKQCGHAEGAHPRLGVVGVVIDEPLLRGPTSQGR